MKILKFIPGKIRRQISDKRAHLGLARTGARRVSLETDTGSQVAQMFYVVISENTYTLVEQTDDASASQGNALLCEWSEDLQRALAANCHNIGSFAALEHKLAELTNSVRVENIDTVLCDFVSMLKVNEDTRPPRPANMLKGVIITHYAGFDMPNVRRHTTNVLGSNVFPPRVEHPEAGQIRV